MKWSTWAKWLCAKAAITEEKAGTFLESLADLPIEIENPTRPLVFASVRALASRYKLTCYDAAYLELAIRHNLLPRVP